MADDKIRIKAEVELDPDQILEAFRKRNPGLDPDQEQQILPQYTRGYVEGVISALLQDDNKSGLYDLVFAVTAAAKK